ncbi:MAG TPA: hypothetical protein VGN97_21860 [Mesorhizobium sp.]|jgi:hypothetical protein|nr:hypothetical protein [Mesorhizobium sp.]
MLDLTRLPDWDRRLARVTERHMTLPGQWGVSDCLLTVFDAVEAVTGHDPGHAIRGRYKTARGATGHLRRRGFRNVEEALAALFPPVGRLLAQRGDLGVILEGDVLAAGYVTELGFAVKTETGLVFRPQTDIRSAFKVG